MIGSVRRPKKSVEGAGRDRPGGLRGPLVTVRAAHHCFTVKREKRRRGLCESVAGVEQNGAGAVVPLSPLASPPPLPVYLNATKRHKRRSETASTRPASRQTVRFL